jgi:indolepyruvate ferredoxin oxidoreductase alpha subunit
MKIPGLFQAGDVFTSGSFIREKRGALIYYVATDFTPSSTQHTIDPRNLFKNCMVPVFEPRNHQEMHEAANIATEIGRKFNTQVVILANGGLCHSEGLVSLREITKRDPVNVPEDLRNFNVLPSIARLNYDIVMDERMPGLTRMVEESPLNDWIKGSGNKGIITYGMNTAFVKEVREMYRADFDILSLAFTNPLPLELIKRFTAAIKGEIYVFEDGYQYLQAEIERLGIRVIGKDRYSKITEWSPVLIAKTLCYDVAIRRTNLPPVSRPPMICPGCPYHLFANAVAAKKKAGGIKTVFGDIGCNALLYFLNAMDTGLAMGASDAKRQGYVISRPEMAAKCISVIGDSTECHSGMDATRNSVFKNVPGVKVVLDNYWTAMTGAQPSPTSPHNLAGETIRFNLEQALAGNGTKVMTVGAYDRKGIKKALSTALKAAANHEFVTLIVQGSCVKQVPSTLKGARVTIDETKCEQCDFCLMCPGIQQGENGFPQFTNLCNGCGGELPACLQMCPYHAMTVKADEKASDKRKTGIRFPEPPAIEPETLERSALPERLSLAIRGVGGQGTLFFGRVMTELAFLAGYDQYNIVKGETHGMAQMGGPVISTFSCGAVHSPVLYPGKTDALIAMEMSEVLRPGFLELLNPNGTIVLADTKIIPQNVTAEAYPTFEDVKKETAGLKLVRVNALEEAINLGDITGRIANVVLIGVLSKLTPFASFPESLWLQAISKVSPNPKVWAGNYGAFQAGRKLV